PLTVTFAGRVRHATRRIGTQVRRPFHLGGGCLRLNQVAAIHAGNGAGQQGSLAGGAFRRRARRGRGLRGAPSRVRRGGGGRGGGGGAGGVATALPPPPDAAAPTAAGCPPPTVKAFWQLGQRNCLPAELSASCIGLVQCGHRITSGMGSILILTSPKRERG